MNGVSSLLLNIHNDGPDCSGYPGVMITVDTEGVYFPNANPYEGEGVFTTWWYAIFAESTYHANILFDVSPFIPPEVEITFTARAITMGCLDEYCIEDPYLMDCLLYTSPSPRDGLLSRMPSSA